MESAMLVLLLVLAGLLTYLLFSPKSILGPYLDKLCQDKKDQWTGETIGESPFKVQEGTPFTASLEEPFDDPEVPNRPKKAKPRKTKKRKYTKRSKK
jgi:hypothetical protein